MTTTFEIHGHVMGPIWQPGYDRCFKQTALAFGRERAKSLREAVELIVLHDGDFSQTPKLTADSYLTVVKRSGSRLSQRYFPMDMFPSVRDYMTDDLPDYED